MQSLSWTSIIGITFVLAGAFLFYHTFHPDYAVSIATAGRGPVFFPRILLGLMLVLSLAVVFEGRNEQQSPISRKQLITVVLTLGVTAAYIYSITAAGFLISTIACTLILPGLLGYRNWKMVLAVSAVYPVSVWYLFDRIFKIILPVSPWFDSF